MQYFDNIYIKFTILFNKQKKWLVIGGRNSYYNKKDNGGMEHE